MSRKLMVEDPIDSFATIVAFVELLYGNTYGSQAGRIKQWIDHRKFRSLGDVMRYTQSKARIKGISKADIKYIKQIIMMMGHKPN